MKAKAKAKNIKCLDDFLKSYQKQKQAQEALDYAKLKVVNYLQDNELKNISYKSKLFSLCEKNTFEYSQLVKEMSEAAYNQKKIEELSGDAKLKSTTNYIRLSEAKEESK